MLIWDLALVNESTSVSMSEQTQVLWQSLCPQRLMLCALAPELIRQDTESGKISKSYLACLSGTEEHE